MNLDKHLYTGEKKINGDDDVREPTTSFRHTIISRHRVNSLLFSGVGVLSFPWLRVAGLDTLGPRVVELGIAVISTLLEPSTTSSAATTFTGFAGAALRTSGRHRGSLFCQLRKIIWVFERRMDRDQKSSMLKRTALAGLHALGPRVVKLGVADIATLLEPSTTSSAAT